MRAVPLCAPRSFDEHARKSTSTACPARRTTTAASPNGNLASERNRNLGRKSAPGGAAGARQDEGARRSPVMRKPCCRRTSGPTVDALRALGFAAASDAAVIARAAREAPQLLAACSSAAAMWAANAATVSPSSDTADGRVHFTPANLASHFHRALETPTTTRVLRTIFADVDKLRRPRTAARHSAIRRRRRCQPHARLSPTTPTRGIEMFVYGRVALRCRSPRAAPLSRPRQTREASEAVARRHGLDPAAHRVRPAAPGRDRRRRVSQRRHRGGNRRRALCHERAFVMQDAILRTRARQDRRRVRCNRRARRRDRRRIARSRRICSTASSCRARTDRCCSSRQPSAWKTRSVAAYLGRLTSGAGPIRELRDFDLRQSMRNGGGPACLRLRVRLSAPERQSISANVWLDAGLHASLAAWIGRHYRDRVERCRSRRSCPARRRPPRTWTN